MSDDWSAIEANEIRLWVGDPESPLWCPTCLLPSGYRASVQRDPADPPTSWFYGCVTDKGHSQQVMEHHETERGESDGA